MIFSGNLIFLSIIAAILAGIAWFIGSAAYLQHTKDQTFAKYASYLCVFLLVLIIVGMALVNFQITLTLLTFGATLMVGIDCLFFYKKRLAKGYAPAGIIRDAYGFFWVLLLVWVIRSFIVQPYRVPTGSLEPTVMPGDFLLVNQFAYGLRFPIGNHQIVRVGQPERGDIVLFYPPTDPNIIYVKRVIGLPGDHIVFKDRVLYINGKRMTQKPLGKAMDKEPQQAGASLLQIPVLVKEEDLDGVKHKIYLTPYATSLDKDFDLHVPLEHYFMMGDNRDDSDDSRVFGTVPARNLIGKAFLIWMSWDSVHHRVVWHRIGLPVK